MLSPEIKSTTIYPRLKQAASDFGYKRFFAVLLVMVTLASPMYALLLGEHKVEATHTAISFAASSHYSSGTVHYDSMYGAVSADFNNDQYMDIVSTDYSGNSDIYVLLNDGDGTFAAAVTYTVGINSMTLRVADFNNDDFVDIAVLREAAEVVVLLNDGDGTFTLSAAYSVGSGYYSFGIVLGDYNEDEYMDIATMDSQIGVEESVSILINDGDGTFAPAVTYGLGTNPYGDMHSVDINNDDHLDLIVPNGGATGISTLLGIGDGTFAAAVEYLDSACGPFLVEVGHFNNDDYIDIVTDDCNDLSVRINDGDGTFAAAVTYAGAAGIHDLSVGDLNNDDFADIIASKGPTDNVGVFLNDGDGTFAAVVNYTVGDEPSTVSHADFNQDGNLDILTGNNNSKNVSVLRGLGDGTFAAAATFATDASGVAGPYGPILLEDFNNDEMIDIGVSNVKNSLTPADSISILLNDVVLPTVNLIASSGTGPESTSSPVIEVEVTAANDSDVTVDYAVTGGTATGGGVDYTLASGTLSIPDPMTSGVIPLMIVDDGTVEADETVIITLSNSTNALLVAPTSFTYTITNDDSSGGGSSGGSSNNNNNNSPGPGLQYPTTPISPITPSYPGSPTYPNAGGNPSNPTNPRSPNSATLIAPVQQFARNLGYGNVGEDVKRLQQFLNMNEYDLAASGYGSPSSETTYFGPRTFRAVKAFQEAFAPQILTPLGLVTGTGYFGISTRTFVNNLLK